MRLDGRGTADCLASRARNEGFGTRAGDDAAGQRSALLDDVSGSRDIDKVTHALIKCGTGEELIERVRTA